MTLVKINKTGCVCVCKRLEFIKESFVMFVALGIIIYIMFTRVYERDNISVNNRNLLLKDDTYTLL